MDIRNNVDLKPFNSFGVTARAKYFTEITDWHQLVSLISNDHYRRLPWLIIGAGSNILFTGNFSGLVLKMAIKGISLCAEDEDYCWIRAGAGEAWDNLVQFAVNRDYGGLENLAAIPGSVGAAPVQNIGAYGVEIKDVLSRVEAVSLETGNLQIFQIADCRLAYRDSIFKNELKNKAVVTAVEFRLHKKNHKHIEHADIRRELARRDCPELTYAEMAHAIRDIRRQKLPDPQYLGNAGSFFKNPLVANRHYRLLRQNHPEIVAFPMPGGKVKLAAAWLIEQCGWKGKRVGNTGCYAGHALILVNYGQASGREIRDLAQTIQQSVAKQFAVALQPEVEIIIDSDSEHS